MKNLNTASKVILLIGLLVFAVSGTWVPWKLDEARITPVPERPSIPLAAEPLGYSPIWSPQKPDGGLTHFQNRSIDTTRLLIQWVVIIAGTAASIVFAQLAGNQRDSEPLRPPSPTAAKPASSKMQLRVRGKDIV